MKNNNIVIIIIVAIVVGAASFFGGMKYQQTKVLSSQTGNQQFSQNGQGGFQAGQRTTGAARTRGGMAGGAVIGAITSQDGDSLTVKLQDGSSKIVNISGTTTFSKTDTASKSDLKAGLQIAVFGTTNSDGSVTAQNVQLNPMFRMGQNARNGQVSPTQAK